MKVEILKQFKDKHTKEVYEKGSIQDFTKARVGEIKKSPHKGLIKEIKEDTKKKAKK